MRLGTARDGRRKPAQCIPNSQARIAITMPNERPNTRIMKIFDRSASDHSLKPLNHGELAALEEILFEKNDRLYFRCPVRNKDILAKPEEAVRQLWIVRLTTHYGYPLLPRSRCSRELFRRTIGTELHYGRSIQSSIHETFAFRAR